MPTYPRLARIAAAVADALGRPVAARTLSARQTDDPSITPLHRTWGTHPVNGLTPARLTALLEGADAGDLSQQSELFLDMRDRDPHLDAEMGKRERAILTLPWSIEPPRNPSAKEKRNAAAAGELVAAVPGLEDTLVNMMDACGHGFAALEITWSRPSAGERLPAAIEHRPQSWFKLDRETRTHLRLRDGTPDGADPWPMGWIIHRHAARSGYLHRAGLYRVLTWPWMLRQYSLRDLAEWLEIYGLPMRLGYYPRGAEAAEKAALYRAVRDLGRHAAGIMPEGMRIDLLAAAEGQADPFMAMVHHSEACISRATVGGSLSSTPGATGLGSGVAELQGEVKRDLLVADARQIQTTLATELVYPIAALNGLADDPRRAPTFRIDTREPADLSAFSQSLLRMSQAGAGAMIPLRWVREQTGIPEAQDGEPTLAAAPAADPAAAAPAAPAADPAAAAPAALAAASTGRPPALPPDYAERHTVDLARAADTAVAAILSPIRQEIDAALADGQDLAALGERLLRLYPRLPVADFTAVLAEALTAADLAGRYDLEQGQ